MKKKHKRVFSMEYFLALSIAIVLIISLLFDRFVNLFPHAVILILFILFVTVKIYNAVKNRITLFEYHLSILLIIILGILRFLTIDQNINSMVLAISILVILYSVGIIPSVDRLSKSKNLTIFLIRYFIFAIAVIFLFAGTYATTGDQFLEQGSPVFLDLNQAFYFSTITFTTVGYGDLTPLGINRLIASLEAIIGLMLNIAVIGYILASKRFPIH